MAFLFLTILWSILLFNQNRWNFFHILFLRQSDMTSVHCVGKSLLNWVYNVLIFGLPKAHPSPFPIDRNRHMRAHIVLCCLLWKERFKKEYILLLEKNTESYVYAKTEKEKHHCSISIKHTTFQALKKCTDIFNAPVFPLVLCSNVSAEAKSAAALHSYIVCLYLATT